MTDLCKACSMQDICEIFSLKRKMLGKVDIEISNCKFSVFSKIEEYKIENKEEINKNVLNPNNYLSRVDYLMAKNKKYDETLNNDVPKEKPKKVECKSCGATDYENEISHCNMCGEEICGACGISNNGMTLCSKCWGN